MWQTYYYLLVVYCMVSRSLEHVYNERSTDQMWPASAFYVAHESFKNAAMF